MALYGPVPFVFPDGGFHIVVRTDDGLGGGADIGGHVLIDALNGLDPFVSPCLHVPFAPSLLPISSNAITASSAVLVDAIATGSRSLAQAVVPKQPSFRRRCPEIVIHNFIVQSPKVLCNDSPIEPFNNSTTLVMTHVFKWLHRTICTKQPAAIFFLTNAEAASNLAVVSIVVEHEIFRLTVAIEQSDMNALPRHFFTHAKYRM